MTTEISVPVSRSDNGIKSGVDRGESADASTGENTGESNTRVVTSNYVIEAKHNILSVDMSGTWNEDNTLEYVAAFKRLVHRYFTQEWACVINLRGMDMLLSESFQIETLKALNAWSYIKGMKAVSVVISDNNRSHLLYQFEEIFKVNHPYSTAVCHSELEAAHWLTDQGFNIKTITTHLSYAVLLYNRQTLMDVSLTNEWSNLLDGCLL